MRSMVFKLVSEWPIRSVVVIRPYIFRHVRLCFGLRKRFELDEIEPHFSHNHFVRQGILWCQRKLRMVPGTENLFCTEMHRSEKCFYKAGCIEVVEVHFFVIGSITGLDTGNKQPAFLLFHFEHQVGKGFHLNAIVILFLTKLIYNCKLAVLLFTTFEIRRLISLLVFFNWAIFLLPGRQCSLLFY